MAKGFDELISLIDEIESDMRSAAIIAGQGLLGDMINRIHTDGENSSGGKIGGGYSTKAYYTAIDKFINRGRIPKKNISKNGIWVQLPQGYKSFREYSGRQTDFVDLNYTGGLRNSLLLIETGKGFIIGYPQDLVGNEKEGIGPAELSELLEEQYGVDIFIPTETELQNFFEDLIAELNLE